MKAATLPHPTALSSPELYVMNKGMLYILENELVQHVVMVHVHSPSAAAIDMSLFHRNLAMVNSEYPSVTMSAFAVRAAPCVAGSLGGRVGDSMGSKMKSLKLHVALIPPDMTPRIIMMVDTAVGGRVLPDEHRTGVQDVECGPKHGELALPCHRPGMPQCRTKMN